MYSNNNYNSYPHKHSQIFAMLSFTDENNFQSLDFVLKYMLIIPEPFSK